MPIRAARGRTGLSDKSREFKKARAPGPRALFDVNVLIALLDPDHIGHDVARSWFAANLSAGWASCPITENGAARVMASPSYPNAFAVGEVLSHLAQASSAGNHEFWPDNVSLTDSSIFKREELLGPKQITDRYLLALAVRNGGRLVTFDQAIRPTAVRGAESRHLLLLRG